MKLTVTSRTSQRSGDVKRARRAGEVPAILYSKGKESEPICINRVELATILREIQPGQLSTMQFSLAFGKKERRAIVKEIQYHPTTYQPIHLDFEELHADLPVKVNVPIRFTGAADCAGVKLGGFLRQVIRNVRIEGMPKDIPAEFAVDVRSLALFGTLRLSDISLPKGTRLLMPASEVMVVISKR